MSEKSAGRELTKWVAITVAVLLGSYVGAYYWLVKPDVPLVDHAIGDAGEMYPHYGKSLSGDLEEAVRWSERLAPFFAPVHWLDRRIRPHVWEPTP